LSEVPPVSLCFWIIKIAAMMAMTGGCGAAEGQ
jgi:uncharacterized membrane-anchored protein